MDIYTSDIPKLLENTEHLLAAEKEALINNYDDCIRQAEANFQANKASFIIQA